MLEEKHEIMRYGSVIFLVNCIVRAREIEVGFAYFEVGTPVQFPLRDLTNTQKQAQVFAPQMVVGAKHPVVLGDADGPLILKRIG